MNTKASLFFITFWFVVISLIYFHATDAFDQDLGRHLKLGEIIWETKQVPKTNLFSYTNPDEPVFNSHWGSQVIFYLVHRLSGANGLIILSTLFNTAAFGMLFALAVRRVGILIPSMLFIPFSFMLLDRSWIRPEMFGNLFFAIVLVALFSPRARRLIKWAFPVIAFLWMNLHISAVFGVFAMGVILFQDTLEKISNVLILILTIAALLISPFGLNGVISAFTVLNKYGYTIVENQSWLFLRDYGGFSLVSHIAFGFVVVFLSFLMTLRKLRRLLVGEIILLVATSILTLRFVRNEVLFAYTAFLATAFNFGRLRGESGRLGRLGLLGSMVALVVGVLVIISSHNAAGLPIGLGNRESYQAGVDFFVKNNLQGPIFNNFDIGGYLIYRLYPKETVFVDNRPEAYPVAFFADVYKPMQLDPAIFEKEAEHFGFRTIIWGRRDITPWSRDFLAKITINPLWKEIYRDDAMVIFTKVQ